MAVLVFGIYFFSFLVVTAFLTETVIPKITRKNCNSSDRGLWIR